MQAKEEKSIPEKKAFPPVFQLVGYSNSGKTTLLTELIKRLEALQIRVGVIKHDGAHHFQLDQPGKDTWRYREAGASLVAIQSANRTAFVEERAVPLAQLVERMAEAGAEFILVEGFKREDYPKLVLLREDRDAALLNQVTSAAALVLWPTLRTQMQSLLLPSLPVFDLNDYEGITAFLTE